MGRQSGEEARSRQEAAAGWFTRLSQPAVTTDALREFRAWRRDPENRRAYEGMESVWKQAGALATDPEILALRARIGQTVADRPKRRARRRVLGMAGGAVLATAAVLTVAYVHRPPTYASGLGEQRVIRLEDGSVLRLNTDSRAVVRYSERTRELGLERGQALFEVAHDPGRPFLVRANGVTVRAVGTVFDVRRAGPQVGVTLLEGVVQVSNGSKGTHTLRPNEHLDVVDGQLKTPTPTDAAADTSWTVRRLTFKATPLGAAVAEVNRYSDKKITLAANDLAASPVNGVFETGDTKGFAAAVALVFDLQVTPGRQGRLVLDRPGRPAPGKN